MPRKKPYEDGCATAHALDLIGERWALLIVRELIPGPKRFSDLKAALPGISTNILTTRLGELETGHILVRKALPPPASAQVYELTAWGAELEPLIKDLGRWAARSPTLVGGKPMSAASVMLSLRTMFSPDKAGALSATLSLRLGDTPHRIAIENRTLTIEVGTIETADATIAGDPDLVAAAIYAGMPLKEAEAHGLKLSGNRKLIDRFVKLFPLPEKAPETAPV